MERSRQQDRWFYVTEGCSLRTTGEIKEDKRPQTLSRKYQLFTYKFEAGDYQWEETMEFPERWFKFFSQKKNTLNTDDSSFGRRSTNRYTRHRLLPKWITDGQNTICLGNNQEKLHKNHILILFYSPYGICVAMAPVIKCKSGFL